MISENKLKHSLGVARKCKEIASIFVPNYETNNYFMMGYLHDIGYESNESDEHSAKGYLLCLNFGIKDNNYIQAIKLHGSFIPVERMTLEYAILVYSDLTTSYTGEAIPIEDRITSIKERYGENSRQFLTVVCQKYELIKYFEKLISNNPILKEKIKEKIIF